MSPSLDRNPILGLFPVNQLLQRLSALCDLSGIAIDASLMIPNQQGQRRCEKALSSVALSRHLVRQGFQHLGRKKWQIECYPHPAMIEMFRLDRRLSYKKGLVAEGRAGQKQLADPITYSVICHKSVV
ncbi:MAG: hypothetical protein P8163_14015 [Candidatus Thiodiazotropha sp.]